MFRELTRKKQQLTQQECIDILNNEKRGVLSVIGEGGYPYGMPMNHFYNETDGKIYFHSGKSGHRLDAIAKNNKACFCVHDSGKREQDDWALTIKSVIAFGKIEVISDMERIVDITTRLSLKFTSDTQYIKSEIEKYAVGTLLLALSIEHICGKTVKEN